MRRCSWRSVGLALLSTVIVVAVGGNALATTLVDQPWDGGSQATASQVFPDVPNASSYAFDDFSLSQGAYLTALTAYGTASGNSAYNTAVTGEIWSGLPTMGGALLLSGAGVQSVGNLVIDFGGQFLAAGDYWITAYPTRPFAGGGQWWWYNTLPVNDSEHYFYNPANYFGHGTTPVPGSTLNFGLASDLAFTLDGSLTGPAIPEPATLTLLGLGVAGLAGRLRSRRRQIGKP